MVDFPTLALGLGVGVSLIFSAFFSLTEAALLSVSRTRLRYLADEGNPRAKLALHLLQRPRRLLATILIGNNVVNTLASVLATALAIQLFQSYALGIATGALTLLLLLIGEVTPKTFANEHAEWAALHVARPIRFFVVLFLPVERTLSWMARALLRATGASRLKPAHFHTEEEIKVLLRMGRERGHIGPYEDKLIRAIFEFNDLEVADVMRAREEVTSVRPQDSLDSVMQLVRRTGLSRFPVLDETGRHPLGLIYAKDLLLLGPEQLPSLAVSSILRALPKVPPDFSATGALEKLQAEAAQMVAVVNPQDEMVGLVTLEDLLEEIVGEISDEYEGARRRTEHDRLERKQPAVGAPKA